jgi:hypothetical protein
MPRTGVPPTILLANELEKVQTGIEELKDAINQNVCKLGVKC